MVRWWVLIHCGHISGWLLSKGLPFSFVYYKLFEMLASDMESIGEALLPRASPNLRAIA